MAKNIPSPYLAAPPPARHVRAAGDQPHHYLYSLEDELVVIPLEFQTSGGALVVSSVKTGNRVFVSDQGGGNLRIYHPYVEVDGKHLHLTPDTDQTLTVISTNVPQGYTDIAVPVGEITWQGYLAFRATKGIEEPEVYQVATPIRDSNLRRSLAEREREGVQSSVPGLCVSWLNFRVDISGDPIASSARGSLAYNVSHTGAGTYELVFTTAFGPGTVASGTAEGVSGSAVVDPSQYNKIDLKLVADPADQARVSLLVFHPVTSEGRDAMTEQPTLPPRSLHARDGVYCSCSLMRDLVFIPVSISLTGGNIAVDEVDTAIPPNVAVTKDGNDYQLEIGWSPVELVGASFVNRTDAAPPLTIAYDNAATGTITITTTATDAVITGWICAATNSER